MRGVGHDRSSEIVLIGEGEVTAQKKPLELSENFLVGAQRFKLFDEFFVQHENQHAIMRSDLYFKYRIIQRGPKNARSVCPTCYFIHILPIPDHGLFSALLVYLFLIEPNRRDPTRTSCVYEQQSEKRGMLCIPLFLTRSVRRKNPAPAKCRKAACNFCTFSARRRISPFPLPALP